MKLFRKVLFWIHLPVGVIAGLVILIMSATGVLLTYERQIIAWADTRNYQVSPPSPAAARLPVETLLAKVREAQLDVAPTTITLRADTSKPATIALTGGRTIFVNPYTGTVLGEGAAKVREFFRVMTNWHRWLGANGENRATARAITGACNLGFLFLVVSGFYLWWPRTWTWSQFINVLWFKRGLPGKARDFNWHNVIGFWSLAPLFIVVLSGVAISYTWAGNLVYRMVGETPPAPRAAPGQPPVNAGPQAGGTARREGEAPRTPDSTTRPAEGQQAEGLPRTGERSATPSGNSTAAPRPQRDSTPPAQVSFEGLNQSWARAEQQQADWQIISLRLPTSASAPLTFIIDQGDGGQPQKRAQLTLDRKSSEVVRWEPFSSYTTGRQLRSFLRFAHTGEVAGIAGQTIAGLVSAGGTVLVWTGLALAWRRFRAWFGRRFKTSPVASPLVDEATSTN